jgi:hypothetical protein
LETFFFEKKLKKLVSKVFENFKQITVFAIFTQQTTVLIIELGVIYQINSK